METSIKTSVLKVVSGDLCLYGIDIKQPAAPVKKRDKVNHIIIFDRSGSMTWLLDDLCDDLIKLVEVIQKGDTLTLGWFSTQGKYNWIFKGLSVDENKQAIIDAINKNRQSIALTCFSDILTDTAENVIDDLGVLGGAFTLEFMTDGYPVVDNYTKEVSRVMDALSKISAKITSIKFIGYGDYYNKELMMKMAEKSGGSLVHASHLIDFEQQTISLITGDVASKRIPVVLPKGNFKVISAFVLSGVDDIATVPVDDDNVAYVPEGTLYLYALCNKYLTEFPVDESNNVGPLLAASYIETAAMRTDNAMDILRVVGDAHLMRLVDNSWTNAEYGKSQEAIKQACFDTTSRYTEGRVTNYKTDPNAFCLVDALDMLVDDPKAYFYPLHPTFAYKRIGVKTTPREGYPKFHADDRVACPFNKLTWNSTRLNLSVTTTIPGFVYLGEDAIDHDLNPNFETVAWRTYTIVKDGILHTTTIPASMSRSVFDTLKANGMIAPIYTWNELGIFPVRFDVVPLVNRNMAVPITSDQYCSMLSDELYTEYKQKYLKWYIAKIDPTGIATKETSYSPDQVEYLKSKGINAKGEYAPPVDKGEATDYYHAKSFDVKIKGFSSAPKVEDVIEKEGLGKSLTPSEVLMNAVVYYYTVKARSDGVDGLPDQTLSWAVRELETAKKYLAATRKSIQSARFAILLCKKWFPDLKERDGAKVSWGGREYTFSIEEKKVEY